LTTKTKSKAKKVQEVYTCPECGKMNIYEHVAHRIRYFREQSQLTQDQVAKVLGVSTNTISRWETATYKIALDDLQKVAQVFGLRTSMLLPFEEAETTQDVVAGILHGLPADDISEVLTFADFRRQRSQLSTK
jgi:transcriptional regulator with XRE-family HTH domain